MKQDDDWYEAVVLEGDKIGRTLGFPTANLDASVLAHIKREGVYAATVRVKNKEYNGALYLGPRLVLNEILRVLEIFLLDFSDDIYGETVRFQLGKFVRGPMDFASLDELIAQLNADVAAIRAAV